MKLPRLSIFPLALLILPCSCRDSDTLGDSKPAEIAPQPEPVKPSVAYRGIMEGMREQAANILDLTKRYEDLEHDFRFWDSRKGEKPSRNAWNADNQAAYSALTAEAEEILSKVAEVEQRVRDTQPAPAEFREPVRLLVEMQISLRLMADQLSPRGGGDHLFIRASMEQIENEAAKFVAMMKRADLMLPR